MSPRPAAAVSLPNRRATSAPRARQQRGRQTEDAILDATLRLLATRGIHGMSLDLLAEHVGVAKSSILWHFGSKEDLLLRVAERLVEGVVGGPARDMLALPTLAERAEALWRFYSETLQERSELRRLVLWLIFECIDERPELRARLQRLYHAIRGQFEAGLHGAVADPARRRRLAILTTAVLDGVFLQWLLEPEAVDFKDLQRELRGLSAPRRPRRTRKGR